MASDSQLFQTTGIPHKHDRVANDSLYGKFPNGPLNGNAAVDDASESLSLTTKRVQMHLTSIEDRCDLNSLLNDDKKYQVDLRNRYSTQQRQDKSLALLSVNELQSFADVQCVSPQAVLLFSWHKVLNVYANGDHSIVLVTGDRSLSVDAQVYLGMPNMVDHIEQQSKTCIAGVRSSEPDHLGTTERLLNLGDTNFGLFDSHVIFAGNKVHTSTLLHPITASFYLPTNGNAKLTISFAEELFSSSIIDGFGSTLQTVLGQTIKTPLKLISQLDFLTGQQLLKLDEWNFTDGEYDRSARLNDLFERAVSQTPASTAVVYKDRSLSYDELNSTANRLAHFLLREANAATEQVIALFLDKSEFLIAMVIGIWKSGACYSPIDPTYPDARVKFSLDDTGARLIVTNHWHAQRIRRVSSHLHDVMIIELEPLLERLSGDTIYPSVNLNLDLRSDQLAYITYTSGTTGVPKGIKKRHTNVINSITDIAERYNVKDGHEAVVLFSPYVFEPFARQTLIALLNSQTLVVVDDDEKLDPVAFPALMKKYGVTYLNGTASVLQEYDYTNCPSLKRLVLVGEDLTSVRYEALRRKFKKHIINEYGFTESAFVTAIKAFQSHDSRPNRSLGRPLRNVKCYVLDHNLRRKPIGAIGELYIGGQGVSEGYLNRPELTKERFLLNPYQTPEECSRGANKIIYRTGDLARWIPDSHEIEYLGRNDFQIKLRGIRIEPAEIESVLTCHVGVERGVVVVKNAAKNGEKSDLGTQHLVGYWTGDHSLKENSLLEYLESKLPRYMVPTRLVHIQRVPTTINGKVDFRALPGVELTKRSAAKHGPRTIAQETLRKIWSNLLNLREETIGIDHNFFRLGGNSITCIQLIGQVRKNMRISLTVEDVFADKNIERLAARAEKQAGESKISLPESTNSTDNQGKSSNSMGTDSGSERELLYLANSLQQGFMYDFLKHGWDHAYVMQYVCNYRRGIDEELYKATWKYAQQRYCCLRIRFEARTEVYQVIQNDHQLDFRYLEHQHMRSKTEQYVAFQVLQDADRREPYYLDRGPLFRVYLVRYDNSTYNLLFSCHHSILDGWSIPILLDFVHETYLLQRKNIAPSLEDTVYHESQMLSTTLRDQNLPYWREQVDRIQERCDLRGLMRDSVRYKVNLNSYDSVLKQKEKSIALGNTWKNHLRSICADREIMLHSVLQFVCHKVLNIYGRGRQSVVGTIVSGRNLPLADVDAAVGLFINTLPLVVEHESQHHVRVIDAIRNIQQSVIAMNMRSSVDLGRLTPGRMTHELFDCLFVLENYPSLDKAKSERLRRELVLETHGTTEKLTYPLAFVCSETDSGGIVVTLRYASELFTDETIDDILDVFQSLYNQLPTKLDDNVSELEFLGAKQLTQLSHWNNSNVDYSQNTLNVIFEQITCEHAEKVALIDENQQFSYTMLNEAANRLARLLRRSVKTAPDSVVALLLSKNVSLFVAILAVWKSGMAYTPIDASFPRDRVQYILEDTAAVAVLCDEDKSSDISGLSSFEPAILPIDVALRESHCFASDNLEPITCNTDLAYIYFTSGTTGKPKGVMIEHRGVVNLQSSLSKTFELRKTSDEVFLSFSNYTFDHFVEQMTDALLNGQTLLILNDEMRADKDRLYRYMTRHRVTYLSGTPSVISMYDYEQFPWLRRIDCVGEDFSEPVFNKIRQGFDGLIVNGYGPTEVSITTHKRLYRPGDRRSNKSIGFQIHNSRTYVLDENMKRVPIGAVGEMYLGGDGVGRGYLNRPELTSKVFPPNPYQSDDDRASQRDSRLYKTGDLVRWLPNGEIEYLGRNDFQIKLRGQRIELGEIEAAVMSCRSIVHVAVVPRKRHIEGVNVPQTFLTGYFVASEALLEPDVKAELRDKLPEHLIPNRLVQVSHLPVTVSGKLDTKKLPEVYYRSSNTYVAPKTDTETRMRNIWASVLGISAQDISVIEDFFSLGGDSLLTTKLSFLITKHFNRSVTVAHIFKHRTVRALTQYTMQEAVGARIITKQTHVGAATQASLPQERLLFVENFLQGSNAYNVPKYLQLPPSTCPRALRRAIISLLERHEAFRTLLQLDSSTGTAVQQILGPESAISKMSFTDIDVLSYHDLDARLDSESRHVFNLSSEIPIRLMLSHINEANVFVLAFNIHHTAMDAWSWDILKRDLSALYCFQFGTQATTALPELSITYADYSVWQRRLLADERGQILRRYWTNLLEGYRTVELPTDIPRPRIFDYDGRDFEMSIAEKTFTRVQGLAKTLQTSPFSVFLSAYCLVLAVYANQDDIVVGLPMANRHHPDVENTIGCFINMVPLRTKIEDSKSLAEFITAVNHQVEEAQLNQDYPFEELVRAMHLEYTPNRHPIFQHVFSSDIVSLSAKGKDVGSELLQLREYRPHTRIHSSSKFDLSTTLSERDGQMLMNFNWPSSLFKEQSISALASTYQLILMQLLDSSNTSYKIKDLSLVEDTPHIKSAMPKPKSMNTTPASLAHLFQYHASIQLKHTAVTCEDQMLSYDQLNDQSSQMANHLYSRGMRAGSFLGLMLEPCVDMIVTILAAWKMGVAYVPFSTEGVPISRIAYMIQDASIDTVVSHTKHQPKLAAAGCQHVINLDDYSVREKISDESNIFESTANGESIAYCIYTSGTTGLPKGVLVPQRGIVNLAIDLSERYFGGNTAASEAVLLVSNYVFDFSVEQFALSILSGNKLIITPNGIGTDEEFYSYVNREALTYLSGTPSVISRLDLSAIKRLSMITSAGEQLHQDEFDRMRHKFKGPINNAYGTTETAVYNLIQLFGEDDTFVNTLGKPIAGQCAYVANHNLKLVPEGAVGELYLSGVGVASRYINRPDLTSERFIKNPFKTAPDDLMHDKVYRTGDLVRRLPNGDIGFMGRSDHQVKMRGFRVELGEVQSVMATYPSISSCVVLARSHRADVAHGEADYLVGYYTSDDDKDHKEHIRQHLVERIPSYLVPTFLIHIPGNLPTTVHGKLDTSQLPNPEHPKTTENRLARDETENKLCHIWSVMLGTQVSIDDDFFRIGGDSILSLQLVRDMNAQVGLQVNVKELFELRTIAQISEHFAGNRGENLTHIHCEQGTLTGSVDLLPIQRWFFAKALIRQSHWNQCFTLRTHNLDVDRLRRAYQELQVYHDALRLCFIKSDGGQIVQCYGSNTANVELQRLASSDECGLRHQLTSLQCSLDIETGRVGVAMYLPDSMPPKGTIWFAFHHLVIDSVSWRIIARDLQSIYEGRSLPPKGTSYRQWAKAVSQYTPMPGEEAYWQATISKSKQLRVECTLSVKTDHSLKISESDTNTLTRNGPRNFQTNTQAILLAASAKSLRYWNSSITAITLESHGREPFDSTQDISNTVGWFTTLYPFILPQSENLSNLVQETTVALDQIPRKGLGFGPIHGYNDLPSVSFNYLGQISTSTADKNLWHLRSATDSKWGDSRAPEDSGANDSVLDITAWVENNHLEIELSGLLDPATLRHLTQSMQDSLSELTYLISNTQYQPPATAPAPTEVNVEPFIPYFTFFDAPRKGTQLTLLPPGEGGAESYFHNLVSTLNTTRIVAFNNLHLHSPSSDATFETLAEKYIAWLRQVQPNGPYNLLGWSFGGLLALEMAIQLLGAGEEVATLMFVDSYFDVRAASKAIGRSEEKDILDPINYFYNPLGERLETVREKVGKVVLFKAEDGNERPRDQRQKDLFHWYAMSRANALDEWLGQERVDVKTIEGETHFTWAKNGECVQWMSGVIKRLVEGDE